jgi:predicted HicB family RNase H-like nuclease
MKYKNYYASISFDDETALFHGQVADIQDIITFQGKNMEELEQAFKESIDDYLCWCQERGEEPEKPAKKA